MPIALTSADVVRKLASAAPLEGRGLVVEEREQRLWVVGILESRWDYHVAAVGMASLSASPGSKGTTVAILGPGRIAVYDCFPALELRAGQITSPFVRFLEYPRVFAAFKAIIQRVFKNRAQFTDSFPKPHDPATQIPYLVADTWQRVVRMTINAQHGGAFVVTEPAALEHVEIKYPLQAFSFGERLVRFWETSFHSPVDAAVALQKVYDWRDAYADLSEATKSLVSFSKVDGSVVLDKELNVLGFGAKLYAPAGAEGNNVPCVNPWTGRVDSELLDRIGRFGTRHTSAFRFCSCNPGTIAFVVSQDGDVRIFIREADSVTMIEATDYPPKV